MYQAIETDGKNMHHILYILINNIQECERTHTTRTWICSYKSRAILYHTKINMGCGNVLWMSISMVQCLTSWTYSYTCSGEIFHSIPTHNAHYIRTHQNTHAHITYELTKTHMRTLHTNSPTHTCAHYIRIHQYTHAHITYEFTNTHI